MSNQKMQQFEQFLRLALGWLERRWRVILALGAVVTIGLVLSIGVAQSVWFDEAYSLTLAKSSISQLVHLTSLDVHPPLYYLLLKAWGSLFGWGDIALRTLGALLGGLLVIFGSLLVKKLFGIKTMLITLPFITLAPFLLRYDFELRMYALAGLIGVLATFILVMAVDARHHKKQLWLTYALLVAIGMYTVYYIALLWIAHLVWLVYRACKQKQPIHKQPWVLAFTGSFILFLPWLPSFASQLTNGALAGISQAMTIDNLIGIISFSFLYQPTWQLTATSSLTMIGILGVLVWLAINTYKLSTKQQRGWLALLVAYISVPIMFITLLSLVKPFYVERYLEPILPGGYLLVGVMVAIVARRKTRQAIIVGLFLVLVSVLGVIHLTQIGNYNFQRLQPITVKETATAIGTCQKGQVVLAADPYVYIELNQYLRASCDMHFFGTEQVLGGGYAPLSGSALRVSDTSDLRTSSQIIYVYYGDVKLYPPSSFTITKTSAYGALNVQTWQSSAK